MSVLSAQTIRWYCNNTYKDKYGNYNDAPPMLSPFCEEERTDVVMDNILHVSHGLGSASYSIRLAQSLHMGQVGVREPNNFGLFSTLEKFMMPNNVCATVHDKSTWARRGLAVQTTFIDPGWQGYLTLEISYHNNDTIKIPKGTGIAQIVFHQLDEETELPYKGKYQNQGEKPQEAL
jgi:dCTP deaminase